jgi:hypothetical protein
MLDWPRIRLAAYLLIAVLAVLLIAWSHSRIKPVSTRSATSHSQQAGPPPVPTLEIAEHVLRGHVVEIKGRSDTNATVMINGERAALVFDRSTFKHFVLVPEGSSVITITAMNDAGGVNTQRVEVQVP